MKVSHSFALLLFLLISGCAAAPAPNSSAARVDQVFSGDAAVVAQRARSRWDALVKHDLEGAWTYISPAGRVAFPLDVYTSRIKVLGWKGVDVKKVDCENERCVVMLSLALDDARTGPLETIITETWVKQDGAWWFLYRG